MQQPDILGFQSMTTESRSRVPAGYSGFRPDLGRFLKERRRAQYGKQQTLADVIGIARPSLSAIESGHAWPRPDTLVALMRELDLCWDMILVEGETLRAPISTDHTPRAAQRQDLGGELREGRMSRGLTIRNLAELSGMSVAQLSRIERGQATRSRAYQDEADDLALESQYRRIRFKNEELHSLSKLVV
jgi:transcriptional regulator with XRE-family HTH domain